MKTRSNNSVCVNIFLELPLTNLYRHYLKMNATSMMYDSYYWSCIDFYTLITYTLTIMKQPLEQNSEAAAGSVLKNFANFTGKYLVGVFFYNAASLQSCNVAKMRLRHRCFPVEFEKFLRVPILKNIYQRLFLYTDYFIMYWFIQFTTVHVFHFHNNFFIM